jgi:superfamily I DNA/RNA helicase
VDDADPESGSRLRKLLYVGMTRARQTLALVTSGAPSRLLAEIDAATLETTEIRHA